MTSGITRSSFVAVFALLAATAAACGDDDTDCVGDENGDVGLTVGLDRNLPAGGNVGTSSTDPGADPPWVNLRVAPESRGDREIADRMLHLDDSFTVAGTTYTVVGICDDRAFLDQE